MLAGSLAVILALTLQQTPPEPVTEAPPAAVETTVTAVSPGMRVAAEFGGALLGTAAGFGVLFVAAALTPLLYGFAYYPALGVATAAVLGAPLGIWLAGGRMGGKGGLGATYVGALAGGVALFVLTAATGGPLPILAALPLATAMIAYEVSHTRASRPRVAMLPFAARGGGGLAFVGAF